MQPYDTDNLFGSRLTTLIHGVLLDADQPLSNREIAQRLLLKHNITMDRTSLYNFSKRVKERTATMYRVNPNNVLRYERLSTTKTRIFYYQLIKKTT